MSKATTIENLQRESGSDYRFARFKTRHALADMVWSKDALRPGDTVPNAELVDVDGRRVALRDYAAGRPVLLVSGSISCPMTVSSTPGVSELYAEYGDEVAFVLLYAREAHPGASYPQPDSLGDKIRHARDAGPALDVSFPVLVDDIDGTLHQALDAVANSAHLIAPDGTLLFRSLWAGDRGSVEDALRDLRAGRAIAKASSGKMLGPVSRAIGYISDTIATAGKGATRDLVVGATPMAVLAGISRFIPVARSKRGAVAMAVMVAAMAGITIALL